ncbi:MAG TPA: DUF3658 domain-containing protein, partial [Feifaniaceae bacterium]|nr:DUF3658 domain-containing protein [Feifaniaceae bacterium]
YCGFLHFLSCYPNAIVFIVDADVQQKGSEVSPCLGNKIDDLDEVKLDVLKKTATKLTQIDEHLCAWDRLVAENSPLRIMQKSRPRSAQADYYDSIILENIPEKPTRIIRVIADILFKAGRLEHDFYLLERIKLLIASKKIDLVEQSSPYNRSLISG